MTQSKERQSDSETDGNDSFVNSIGSLQNLAFLKKFETSNMDFRITTSPPPTSGDLFPRLCFS